MTHLISVLASNIKFRRKAGKFTQQRLAEKVNTSCAYISMIEREKCAPSFEIIERIAEALNVDAPELFAVKNYPPESASEIRSILINRFDQFLRASAKEVEKKD